MKVNYPKFLSPLSSGIKGTLQSPFLTIGERIPSQVLKRLNETLKTVLKQFAINPVVPPTSHKGRVVKQEEIASTSSRVATSGNNAGAATSGTGEVATSENNAGAATSGTGGVEPSENNAGAATSGTGGVKPSENNAGAASSGTGGAEPSRNNAVEAASSGTGGVETSGNNAGAATSGTGGAKPSENNPNTDNSTGTVDERTITSAENVVTANSNSETTASAQNPVEADLNSGAEPSRNNAVEADLNSGVATSGNNAGAATSGTGGVEPSENNAGAASSGTGGAEPSRNNAVEAASSGTGDGKTTAQNDVTAASSDPVDGGTGTENAGQAALEVGGDGGPNTPADNVVTANSNRETTASAQNPVEADLNSGVETSGNNAGAASSGTGGVETSGNNAVEAASSGTGDGGTGTENVVEDNSQGSVDGKTTAQNDVTAASSDPVVEAAPDSGAERYEMTFNEAHFKKSANVSKGCERHFLTRFNNFYKEPTVLDIKDAILGTETPFFTEDGVLGWSGNLRGFINFPLGLTYIAAGAALVIPGAAIKNVVAAGIAAYDLVNPKAEIIEKTVENNQDIATFVKQEATRFLNAETPKDKLEVIGTWRIKKGIYLNIKKKIEHTTLVLTQMSELDDALLAYKENPNNNAMEDLKKFLIEEKQLASEELTKMAPEELILKYNQEKTILLKDIDTYITKNVLGITVDYKQQKN